MALFPPGFRDLGASHLADRVRCASNSLSNPETLEWREFLDDGAIRNKVLQCAHTRARAPGDRNTSVRGPGRGWLGGDAAACECAPVVPWLSMRSSASTAPVVHATRTPLALYTTSDERHERRTPLALHAAAAHHHSSGHAAASTFLCLPPWLGSVLLGLLGLRAGTCLCLVVAHEGLHLLNRQRARAPAANAHGKCQLDEAATFWSAH